MLATGKNNKESPVKVAILLNIIGEEGLEIFNNFTISEEDKKKYEKVIEEFEKYLKPTVNEVYERFVFYRRNQHENESVEHFVKELKTLAKTCGFGDQTETMVRDRIVLGVRDKELQEKMLSIKDLDMNKAIKMAKGREITKIQVKEVQEQDNKVEVIKKKSYEGQYRNKFTLCSRCNWRHKPMACPAFGKKCKKCGKDNHFARACKVKEVKVREVMEDDDEDEEGEDEYFVDTVSVVKKVAECSGKVENKSWCETIMVENTKVKFKLDTGSEVNIVPLEIYNSLSKRPKLLKTHILLETYGGFKVKPLGVVKLNCESRASHALQEFVIVETKSRALLGLPACIALGLIKRLDNVEEINSNEKFISKNSDVFQGIGSFKDVIQLKLDDKAVPVARPPRRLPLAIRKRLKDKLDSLIRKKIIEKVDEPSEWISNIVVIEKPDKSLRICLDPQDLNKCLKREPILIPTREEVQTKLAGKKWFSVLDLKDGFYHVKLDKQSSGLCTFSTPFGLYRFVRLPFGLRTAPECFQKLNEKYFGDIEGVLIYIDDLLIAADTEEEHDRIVEKVLARARELNIKFNRNKVQYRVQQVKYLGEIFSFEGVTPDKERVRALNEMPNPKDKKGVQRILGFVNYFRNYIPNLSELTKNIRDLLKNRNEFMWLPCHSKELSKIKEKLAEAPILANFDEKKDIMIQTDASKDGLGCCLLQENKPVFFASRALTECEKNYATIEKEYLGMVFATKKFHNYIYGRPITVITDSKPLVAIAKKNFQNIGSTRLQRLKLKLIQYDMNVEYMPGKLLFVADTLSRAFLEETPEEDETMLEVVHSVGQTTNFTVVDKEAVQSEIENDPVLRRVKFYYFRGWPKTMSKITNDLKLFYKMRNDIFVTENLLFYNNRIIIPNNSKNKILDLLHTGHIGIERMRLKAQELYYWPRINLDIQDFVQNCKICQKFKPANIKEPLIVHNIEPVPFHKIGADICTFANNDYLVIIDYFSKWLEVIVLKNKTSSELIKCFKQTFSRYGIPKILIADNMPFGSFEFKKFAEEWKFKIITSSPRYPKSNGEAESAVKITKNLLRKNNDLELALLSYRSTPIPGIGLSPSQLLMSRRLNTQLPITYNLLVPSENDSDKVLEKIKKKQWLYKEYYDRTAKERKEFKEGENINIRKGREWVPGKIINESNTPRSYVVMDENSKIYRRNSSFLRKSNVETRFKMGNSEDEFGEVNLDKEIINKGSEKSDQEIYTDKGLETQTNNRPKRQIKVPAKFNDYQLY